MFNEQNKTILVYSKKKQKIMKWTKLLNLTKYEKWKM